MLKIVLVGFIIAVYSFVFPFAFAQEVAPQAALPTSSPVEYALPYPGILPDHPLYIFKQLRDTILLVLITKPIRKVEFYILLSDKKLAMGATLLTKKKSDLATQIAGKSITDLEVAEKLIFEIPNGNNNEVANVKDRFEKSVLKHEEVIADMKTLVNDPTQKQKLETQLTTLKTLYQNYLRKK